MLDKNVVLCLLSGFLLTRPVSVAAAPGNVPSTTPEADPGLRAREQARQIASQSNLKVLSLGILEYLQDHDERYPRADRWVEAIMPYVKPYRKSGSPFHDPSAPDGQKFSYAFNRNLSGQTLAKLDAPALTVLLFESNKGVKDASDTGRSVPKPGRHSGGTDYAFTDGHVKWLRDGIQPSYLLSGK